MTFVMKWWRGEDRLWKPFWLGSVVGGIVVGIIANVLGLAGSVPALIGGVIYLLYAIWILVAVWKCAFNVDWVGWGYIVRVLIVGAPVLGFVMVFIGEALNAFYEAFEKAYDP